MARHQQIKNMKTSDAKSILVFFFCYQMQGFFMFLISSKVTLYPARGLLVCTRETAEN